MPPARSRVPDKLNSVGMLVAATTRAICATVATVDKTAPATQAASRSGDFFARDPIAPIVAVLEMNDPDMVLLRELLLHEGVF